MAPDSVSSVRGKSEFIGHTGLSVGTLLQVQFEGLGASRSHLVGMEPGNFLIILTPPIANLGSKLYQKNHAIVRYLFSGRVYAFRSTLLSLIKEPYRLSILTYPTSIENVNLRKHERISSLIAAEMSAKGQLHEGIISDISNGGCSFEFNKSDQRAFPELKVLDEVVISMLLKETSTATVFNATVRSVLTDNENMMAGIQFAQSDFKETDEKAAKELSDYLQKQQNSL
ncbi:MAG: flagellar brake protein [Deltaproteobacteria bacterium]|nr:flagellar brake protein [Deltaproteobacteria bacterium]